MSDVRSSAARRCLIVWAGTPTMIPNVSLFLLLQAGWYTLIWSKRGLIVGFDCFVPGGRTVCESNSSYTKSSLWCLCHICSTNRSPCSMKISESKTSLAGAGERVTWNVEVCPPPLCDPCWLLWRKDRVPDCLVSKKSTEWTWSHMGSSRLLWWKKTSLKCVFKACSVSRGRVDSTCGLG